MPGGRIAENISLLNLTIIVLIKRATMIRVTKIGCFINKKDSIPNSIYALPNSVIRIQKVSGRKELK